MKNTLFSDCQKQLYKYDCGAMSLCNILNNFLEKNFLKYEEILAQLKTTTLWGTFPRYIESFLGHHEVPHHTDAQSLRPSSWNIFLIDGNGFYQDGTDYGHYLISHKIDDSVHHVFDVWDGKVHIIEETELLKFTKNVLV